MKGQLTIESIASTPAGKAAIIRSPTAGVLTHKNVLAALLPGC
jgi:hypothetical protein